MTREDILKNMRAQINVNGYILGVVSGSGLVAKYASLAGADMILALDAGRYRMRGKNSHACFLCYGNSNESVMELGTRELLPLICRGACPVRG